MKTHVKTLAVACLATLAFASCNKEVKEPDAQEEITEETLSLIKNAGFGTSAVQKHEDGYLVEGDIILTDEFLRSKAQYQVLRIGNEEQYHTTNLVSQNRTITVAMDSKLGSNAGYRDALQVMVDRYNAENLTLKFQVVSSGANITFVNAGGNYLASAGFPSSNGNPYSQVKVNARAIGKGTSSTFVNYLATILAHELGHCIGFRHTDYFDRSISCGGAKTNEGASTVGAIHIPGTPLAPNVDRSSWMLACIGSGQNRPFSSYDKTALSYLY